MGSVRFRKGRWYVVLPRGGGARYASGRPKYQEIPLDARSEAEALAALRWYEKQGDAPKLPPKHATVAEEADRYIDRREKRGHRDMRVMRHHFRDYIVPRFGHLTIDEVGRGDVMEFVDDLASEKREPRLAGKTVRNIYGTLAAFFGDLDARSMIAETPCRLKRQHLPPSAPDDAEFYEKHVFTLIETERILGYPSPYRVAYALGFLAGLRAGEIAGLRWSAIDMTARPLWRLTASKSYSGPTKAREVRWIPVHPVLRELLRAQPRERGSEFVLEKMTGGMLSSQAIWHRWGRDLAHLKIRHRRFHDTRRTFSSMLRARGVAKDVVGSLTHAPNRHGDMQERYTTAEWEHLCDVVQLLDVKPRAATVSEIEAARKARGNGMRFHSGRRR